MYLEGKEIKQRNREPNTERRAGKNKWTTILETDDGEIIVEPEHKLDEFGIESRTVATEYTLQDCNFVVLRLQVRVCDLDQTYELVGWVGARHWILHNSAPVTLQQIRPGGWPTRPSAPCGCSQTA